jgi:hypothetical protein
VGVSEVRFNVQPSSYSTANSTSFNVIPDASFNNNVSVNGDLSAKRSVLDSVVFNSNVQLNSLVLANNICLTSPAMLIPPNNQTSSTITSPDGNYIASASSRLSGMYDVAKAFSTLDGSFYWLSAPNSYANGVPVSNVTTTVSGSAVLGEWIQLQVPKPVFVHSYILTPRMDLSTFVSTPTAWVLAGSTDGTNWVQLDVQTNVSANTFQSVPDFQVRFPLTTSSSFSYFRIIFTGSTDAEVGIQTLAFNARFSTGTRFTTSNCTFITPTLFSSNVGIGITNPSYQLQMSSDSAAKPSTSTWTISSDVRVKTDIESANQERCYEIIKTLDLKYYRYKDEYLDIQAAPDRRRLGWIAQEVETIFPKAVSISSNYGMDDCKSLNVDQIYAAMYGCVKKMQLTQETIQANIISLQASIMDLNARIPPA